MIWEKISFYIYLSSYNKNRELTLPISGIYYEDKFIENPGPINEDNIISFLSGYLI